MPIAGTMTGPFTITGTETTLSIYDAVVLANPLNATKNSDNTQFDFNCALILGDRVIASSWTSTEEQIRIDATNFRIELNATFTMGIASPARAGGSLRVVCPGDAFRINGTFRAYAARIYSQARAKGDVGATIYFEECTLAFLDSIEGQTTLAPNTTYVRCFIAGATAVAVKVQGPVSLTNTKVSGATYAFQVFGTSTKTITDYVGQSNANDFIPNQANAGITNVIGAFDGAGVPRTSLILAGINATFGSIFLRWRYSLSSLLAGAGTNGATVRIRNVNDADVFTGTTTAGAIAQQTLTRFEYTNSATGIPRFPYAVKVRKYEITSIDLTYQADNHTQQTAAHTAVPFLPLTQAQAAALTGVALAPSGATGGTITVTEARTLSQLWQYYRQWVATLANFNSDDSWTFDGTALNVGAWTVVGLHNLTGGEITVSTASAAGAISGLQVVGNVTQAAPAALTNVTITGTLTYNAAANANVTYTNSTLGTVANSGAGIVTVKRVNSTLTPGTNVVAYLPTTLSFALNGGRIRVLDHLGVEQFNQTSDGTFELPANATGTWSYKVAKYGEKAIEGTFTINGATIAIAPAYIPDPVVFDALANVSAYLALETDQKIYDAYSLYLASATGILQTKSVTLTPSLLDLGAYSLAPGALLITATAINTNSAAISGVNITTTGTVGTFAPTYPQQIASPAGSTNWLRITPTIGQVYHDSVNSAYSTASATTLLPASFSSAITIYVTRRGYKKQVITVPYTTGLLAPQSFVLIPDTNVLDVATDFTAADLTTSQLIYDAFSQYQSSSAGITDVYVPTKTPGAVSFGAKGFTLAPATDMAASPLQIKSSALTSDTYYSDASFTQGAATLANSVLIRASTLNSEIVFTPDSVTFYPSQAARDSGTTPGLTVTGGVYRFLHGSTVSGVIMSGTVYARVTVGSIVFFADLAIVSGANVLDLGVQGQLTAISAKVDQTPIKVWSEPLDGTIQAKKLLIATTATLAGKATGGGTETLTFRNLSDTANVVTMTVDLNGNRSATIVP